MRKVLALALLSVAVLTTGCQNGMTNDLGETQIKKLKEHYINAQGFSARVTAVSEDFDCVFTVLYSREKGCEIVVTEPRTIAGLVVKVTPDGTSAYFDGLEAALPQMLASSPAVVCCDILTQLTDGTLDDYSWERNDKNEILCYNNSQTLTFSEEGFALKQLRTSTPKDSLNLSFEDFCFLDG